MTRFLLKLAILLAFVLTFTSLAARALGSMQPPNPALRGFTEGCKNKPQPCIYGIVPGLTTIHDAQKQVERLGYDLYSSEEKILHYSNLVGSRKKTEPCSNIHLRNDNNLIVYNIFFVGCDGLTIGELSFLGFPERMLQGPELLIQIGEYSVIQISQYGFKNGEFYLKEWSPNSIVNNLDIGSSTSGAHIALELAGFNWRGFLPYWRYCQLEPTSSDCPQ